jgi:hypothetical protein
VFRGRPGHETVGCAACGRGIVGKAAPSRGRHLAHTMTRGCPPGGRSVRLPRRAEPETAPPSSATSAAGAAVRRSQHPPRAPEHAAAGTARSEDRVISGTPGRHPGAAARGRLLDGTDDIQGTQARHDAPSPDWSCPVTVPPTGPRAISASRARRQPRHARGSSSRRYGAGSTGPDTATADGLIRPPPRPKAGHPAGHAQHDGHVQLPVPHPLCTSSRRSARTSASTPITVLATQTRIFCAAFESRRNLTSFLIGTVARRRLPEEQP